MPTPMPALRNSRFIPKSPHHVALLVAGAISALALPAQAQTSDGDTAARLGPVTVTAARGSQGRPVSAIPGSVSVIDAEQIRAQQAVSRNVGDLLARLVPGLSPSNQSASNFGTQLRGRDFQVLIDGVPQSTPLRRISRDLNTIDLAAVERIEVIRGSAATYGYGATGGIINIITKTGGDDGPNFRTEVGANLSLSHPGDSLSTNIVQDIDGSMGRIDYLLSLSAEKTGGYFDAEGDRIPPDPYQQNGLADSRLYNVLGKVGARLTETQRLQLSVNYYEQEQATDFSTDFTNPFAVPTEKASAVPGEPPGENPGSRNLVVNLEHGIRDIAGSDVTLQAYYQNFESVNAYYAPASFQSELTSEKIGARAAVETPVSLISGTVLTWGVDLLSDKTEQPLLSSGNPLPPDISYVPEVRQTSWAPFVQLELPVTESLLLRGGVRYENIELDIDTFTNTRQTAGGLIPNATVQGGTLDYDAFVYNLGGVYYLTDTIDVFAGFSQGFSVADIGRLLRTTSAASVEELNPEAQVVDNYEVGIRGNWSTIQGTVTVFYNTSDLGTSFGGPPDFAIQRQKEEIYGVEASLEYRPSSLWAAGGTFTWYEGKTDSDGDGDTDTNLDGTRISPAKVTLFGEYNPFPRWRNRLQILHIADRDAFDGSTAYAEGSVDGFTTVDLISEVDVGAGTVRVGIENLLNRQYITPLGQASNLAYSYAAARGAQATVRYTVRY